MKPHRFNGGQGVTIFGKMSNFKKYKEWCSDKAVSYVASSGALVNDVANHRVGESSIQRAVV